MMKVHDYATGCAIVCNGACCCCIGRCFVRALLMSQRMLGSFSVAAVCFNSCTGGSFVEALPFVLVIVLVCRGDVQRAMLVITAAYYFRSLLFGSSVVYCTFAPQVHVFGCGGVRGVQYYSTTDL